MRTVSVGKGSAIAGSEPEPAKFGAQPEPKIGSGWLPAIAGYSSWIGARQQAVMKALPHHKSHSGGLLDAPMLKYDGQSRTPAYGLGVCDARLSYM